MIAKPTTAKTSPTMSIRTNECPIMRSAPLKSPLPSAIDTRTEPPMPISMPNATRTNTTGKIALKAARASGSTCPRNTRSTMLYSAETITPTSAGKKYFTKSFRIGAVRISSQCPSRRCSATTSSVNRFSFMDCSFRKHTLGGKSALVQFTL